jgi:hypothetical protein
LQVLQTKYQHLDLIVQFSWAQELSQTIIGRQSLNL